MDTSTRAPESSTLSISTIAEDLTITGNVTSKGELHLDGQVQGDIHCVSLVLGETAQLEGNVVAQDVIVRGRLIGSVRALRVTLEVPSPRRRLTSFTRVSPLNRARILKATPTPRWTRYHPAQKFRSAEPQLNQTGSQSVERHERANGFIRTLAELLSA